MPSSKESRETHSDGVRVAVNPVDYYSIEWPLERHGSDLTLLEMKAWPSTQAFARGGHGGDVHHAKAFCQIRQGSTGSGMQGRQNLTWWAH